MPGDVMKTAASGSPVRPSAQWQNRANRAIKKSEADNNSLSAGKPGIRVPEGLIYVKNNSGANRDRFDVLGIDGILYGPDQNQQEFQNNPAVIGVTPAATRHTGKFVICAEPIASGAIGRAFVFGACPVQVNIQNVGDVLADVADNDATKLASGSSGAAQILYVQNTAATGTTWAFVRFSGGGGIPNPTARYQAYTPIDDSLKPIWTDIRFGS